MAINQRDGEINPVYQDDDGCRRQLAKLMKDAAKFHDGLLDANGEPVPRHMTIIKTGQLVEVEGCTFRIAHFGKHHLLLEPVKATDALTVTLPEWGGK